MLFRTVKSQSSSRVRTSFPLRAAAFNGVLPEQHHGIRAPRAPRVCLPIEFARGAPARDAPQGEITMQTKGYAGGDCHQASRFLEQALGVVATDRNTAEFYQAAPAELHAQQ